MNIKDIRIDKFWRLFLKEVNKSNDIQYIDCFHFELTEKLANELLELVLSGNKQATCGSLWAYEIEGERIPEKGDYSIVTDWDGNPRCVIETTNVIILSFKDVTFDICSREGEDETLESWRQGHIRFFEEDGKVLGYVFNEDMPVVFEDFKVVYKK